MNINLCDMTCIELSKFQNSGIQILSVLLRHFDQDL